MVQYKGECNSLYNFLDLFLLIFMDALINNVSFHITAKNHKNCLLFFVILLFSLNKTVYINSLLVIFASIFKKK